MSKSNFNIVFSKKLRHYLNINHMTQAELANKLNVGTTSVYNWVNGIKSPRMDKVDAMCEIFDCRRSDLIEDMDGSTQSRDRQSLSPDEHIILEYYNMLNETGQAKAREYLIDLSNNSNNLKQGISTDSENVV